MKGNAAIFNGNYVKFLKDQLKLDDTVRILTGSVDPSSTATLAEAGSLYLNTSGKLYMKMDAGSSTNWRQLLDFVTYASVAGEPHGVPDRTNNTISFDDGSRTLTWAPTGASFEYYDNGVKHTVLTASPLTATITDTEGLWYFYANGSLTATQTFSTTLFTDNVLVAICYWDATNNTAIYLGDERHGTIMDALTHAYLHQTKGTAFISGGALESISADQNGSSAAHAQVGVGATTIADEDIFLSHVATASTSGIPVFYKLGASGVWRKGGVATFPVEVSGTGRLAYNLFSTGIWSVEEVTNNNFVLYHIFATNDTNTPFISVMGQAQYATINAARVGANTELANLVTTGLPTVEFIALGSVIFETRDSYTNAVNARVRTTDLGGTYIDWRTEKINATTSPSDHGNLAGLTDDDHSQYPLSAGRAAGQTLNLGQATSNTFTMNGVSVSATELVHSDGVILEANQINLKNIDTAVCGARTMYGRSRGTLAAPTTVAASDSLMCLDALGHDGTDYVRAVSIEATVDGTPGSNDMPGKVTISVTPDGGTAPEAALVVSANKNTEVKSLSVNATNPTALKRNFIINGNFEMWQRGTSFTSMATSTYSADRFSIGYVTSGVVDITQETSVLPSVDNVSNCLKIACTTSDGSIAAGDFMVLGQKIEGAIAKTLYGKNITIGFWVRSSKTGVYCVAIRNSAVDRSYVQEITINSANTWEYKKFSLTHSATGTWLKDNGIGLRVDVVLASGSTFQTTAGAWQAGNYFATSNQVNWLDSNTATFYISQLMVCDVDDGTQTFIPFGGNNESDRNGCLRYTERFGFEGTACAYATFVATSTTGGVGYMKYYPKRTIPVLTLIGTNGLRTGASSINVTSSNVTFGNAGLNSAPMSVTGIAGVAVNEPGIIRSGVAGTDYALVTAEL